MKSSALASMSERGTVRATVPVITSEIFGTTSGEVRLRVPKLKGIQFETAIIERYKRRECSVEEALIERSYSEVKRESQLANYNTDGRYLSEATNFELYNFVREYKTSDEIRRIWNPKKDESVIHDKDN